MAVPTILMLVLGLAGLLLLFGPGSSESTGGADSYDGERQRQPAEIASAELVLSEYYLRTEEPRRLGARVDQVYRTGQGVLIPVETKVRYRREIRKEDLIELSAQASVLRNTRSPMRPKGQVSTWGYVRVAPPNGAKVTYLRTALLDDAELAGLSDRYHALQEGVMPNPTTNKRTCAHCPKRTGCPAAAN